MTPKLTPEMIEVIETILTHGSRAELLIEQGQVTIVEIKRKMRYKEGFPRLNQQRKIEEK